VRETTFAFCRKLLVGEAEAVRYFKEVQAEAVGHKDELRDRDSLAESAVLVHLDQRQAPHAGEVTELESSTLSQAAGSGSWRSTPPCPPCTGLFAWIPKGPGETSLMYVLPVCAALLLRDMQPRRCRCRHVSLVEKSNVKGEVEFLFAPFSRLHRCISERARQAHRQQPHRHRALIRGLWF
jgi:hypothetical protein